MTTASASATGALTERPRVVNIQVMRAVAALLVVVTHTANLVAQFQDRDLAPTVERLGNLGAVGVDIFFVISGFVMAYSTSELVGGRAAGRFLLLRWVRIAPPYLIVTVVMVVAIGGSTTWRGIVNAVAFLPIIDRDTYSLPPLYLGWTLSFEFAFYLLVAGAVLREPARRLTIVCGAIAALVGSGLVLGDAGPYVLQFLTNPIWLEFALGVALFAVWRAGHLDRVTTRGVAALGAAGVLALAVQALTGFGSIDLAVFVLDGSASWHRVAAWGIPSAVLVAAAIAAPPWEHGRLTALAKQLGDASYSIYLVHVPLMAVYLRLVRELTPELPVALFALLGFVLAALAGYVFARLVEIPLTAGLRRRTDSRS